MNRVIEQVGQDLTHAQRIGLKIKFPDTVNVNFLSG